MYICGSVVLLGAVCDGGIASGPVVTVEGTLVPSSLVLRFAGDSTRGEGLR